jgi:hypothetical protein
MINWILNQKTNKIVYLFYPPWLLIFIFLKTPLYGEVKNIEKVVFIIFWFQFGFYYYITIGINEKLLQLNNGNLIRNNKNLGFQIHSWLNLLILTLLTVVIAIEKNNFELIVITIVLIFIFIVSELIRSVTFTKTIILSEGQQNNDFIIFITTLFLVINPLLGLWSIHKRLKYIFKINK